MARRRTRITKEEIAAAIHEIDVLIAMCDQVKTKAIGLRSNLVPVKAPAPKGGMVQDNFSITQEARILLKRNSRIKTY
jgi:hypothetical protein